MLKKIKKNVRIAVISGGVFLLVLILFFAVQALTRNYMSFRVLWSFHVFVNIATALIFGLLTALLLKNRRLKNKLKKQIEDQRRNTEIIQKKEKTFRLLFDSVSEGIYATDTSGKFVYVNRAMSSIFGYPVNELIGKNSWELARKDAQEQTRLSFVERRSAGETFCTEAECEKSDESPLVCEISMTSIVEERYNFGVVRDVTERNDTNLILRKQAEELKELNAIKDKFFKIIAHDLKSPFNTIMGFTRLLKDNVREFDIDKTESYVEILHNSAEQTFKLLLNLLDWANSQRKKLSFDPEIIALKEFVTKEISNCEDLAFKKNITVSIEINSEIRIFADVNMMKSIMRNLIGNALKFTQKKGKITILAEQENQMIRLSVKDNGMGISKEDKDKLFNPSSFFSTEGTDNEKGTGIGLILCKEFVEIQGGTIRVESETGKGSNFSFTIPVGE